MGPFGHWESSKTIEASIELTSKEKAEVRNNAYSHIKMIVIYALEVIVSLGLQQRKHQHGMVFFQRRVMQLKV